MNITKRLIPINFTKGRGGFKPTAIVLHLMDGTLTGTDAWFRNPKAVASTHYGVGNKGEIYQWVEDENMAWGNGRVFNPSWKGIRKENPNLYTISIEHEGKDEENNGKGHIWTEEQYAADVFLIKQLAARHNIPIDRDHIIIHSEIYSKKPNCTGKGIDMDKLLAMLQQTVTPPKNELVRGDQTNTVYWAGQDGKLHGIPTWDFFTRFFGGSIRLLPQKYIDSLEKKDSFKA